MENEIFPWLSEICQKGGAILGIRKTEYVLVFRPYITLRDGRRLYASEKGIRAFAFWVPQNHS